MAEQEIYLKVNDGESKATVDAVAGSLDDLGKSASDAGENLASLQTSLNEFLTARGKLAGKSPRLYDAKADKAALEDFLRAFQETMKLSPSIRKPIENAQSTAGLPLPAVPSQINMQGISATQAGQAKFFENLMMRLFSHVAAHGKTQLNTGLTYTELTGRSDPQPSPGEPDRPPHQPRQETSPFRKVASQATRGLYSAGTAGGLAASAIEGAAGSSGFGAMGMLKGGGIAALAYGAYKTVSAVGGAVMDKMDAGKTENIEIDKFKRSIGSTADSFVDLKNKSRAVGEQFLLTYEQSRKLTMDFAGMARSNVNGAGLAGVGIGLAQSVGVDDGQGSSYMATMRRSGALSEKTADAKLLAIQFAEALKRTGSTLNASDLMSSISGFAISTSQRALLAPNSEGYAGMLSAMVGTGAPGLKGNVDNAAAILNHADAAFQAGGSMGEASKTLQFQALKGNEVGLLGVKMRQAAGMFATASQVFGNDKSQVNTFLDKDNMSKFGGDKSGIEQVLGMFAGSGMSKQAQLMAAGNHFQNMNPEQIATLMNLRESGKLTGMTDLMSEQVKAHPDLKDKFEKMSAFGYESLSDVAAAKGDQTKLSGVRDKLIRREGLTDEQKKDLEGMSGMAGKPLQDALVKFTTTLEREKTVGEQAQESTAKISQNTSRMVDDLIPAAQKGNTLLESLLSWLAPDSAQGRARKEAEKQGTRDAFGSNSQSMAKRNAFYDRQREIVGKLPPEQAKKELNRLDAAQKDEMGPYAKAEIRGAMRNDPRRLDNTIPPGLYPKMTEIDSDLRRINPNWMPGTTQATFMAESSMDPFAISPKGAKGLAQFMPDAQTDVEKMAGRKFDPFDPMDAAEMFRLRMSQELKRNKTVALAQKSYNAGYGNRNKGFGETEAYPQKISAARLQIPAGNPAEKSNPVQSSTVAFNSPTANIVVRVESADGLRAQTQDVQSSVVFKPRPSGAQPWRSLVQ